MPVHRTAPTMDGAVDRDGPFRRQPGSKESQMRTDILAAVGGTLVAASAFLPVVTGTDPDAPLPATVSTMAGVPMLVLGALIAGAALAAGLGFAGRGLAALIAIDGLAVAAVITALAAESLTNPASLTPLGAAVETTPVTVVAPDIGLILFGIGAAIVLAWAAGVALGRRSTSGPVAIPV
jgi:hypothetical protein